MVRFIDHLPFLVNEKTVAVNRGLPVSFSPPGAGGFVRVRSLGWELVHVLEGLYRVIG